MGIPRDVATQHWDDQIIIPGVLTMSVPWSVKLRSDSRIPQNTTIWVGEGFGSALTITTIAGTDAPLERLADGGLDGVERSGFRRLSSQKQPTTVLGRAALEFSGKFGRTEGEMLVSGVVFMVDTHAVAAALLYRSGDEVAPAVWARVRAGLRPAT